MWHMCDIVLDYFNILLVPQLNWKFFPVLLCHSGNNLLIFYYDELGFLQLI